MCNNTKKKLLQHSKLRVYHEKSRDGWIRKHSVLRKLTEKFYRWRYENFITYIRDKPSDLWYKNKVVLRKLLPYKIKFSLIKWKRTEVVELGKLAADVRRQAYCTRRLWTSLIRSIVFMYLNISQFLFFNMSTNTNNCCNNLKSCNISSMYWVLRQIFLFVKIKAIKTQLDFLNQNYILDLLIALIQSIVMFTFRQFCLNFFSISGQNLSSQSTCFSDKYEVGR